MEHGKRLEALKRCGQGPFRNTIRMLRIIIWALFIVSSSCIKVFPVNDIIQDGSALSDPGNPLDGPNITVEIDQEVLYANVAPGQDGIVTVTGTVHCQVPAYTPDSVYCFVELLPSAGSWPTSVPPQFAFNKATTFQPFAVVVQVPELTPPTDSRDLLISGNWHYTPGIDSGTLGPYYVHIGVNPFTYIVIYCNQENVTMEKGRSRDIEIKVQNIGTKSTNVRIEAHPSNDDINVTLDKSSLSIGPGVGEKVRITFEQTEGEAGFYNVQIIVIDEDPEGMNSPQMTFKLRTTERPISLKTIPFYIKFIVVLTVIFILIALLVIIILRRRKKDGELILRSSRWSNVIK